MGGVYLQKSLLAEPARKVSFRMLYCLMTDVVSYICVILFIFSFVAADVGDTGADFDRVFLQELRDLKVFVNDREIVEEHKRFLKYSFVSKNMEFLYILLHNVGSVKAC